MDLAQLYRIDNYIDTFALGHYARVLDAQNLHNGTQVAFKVLRPEHLLPDGDMRWEYRAFANEAQILEKLNASPHICHLMDCGYVSTIAEAPAGGEIVSCGVDVAAFVAEMSDFAHRGWRPYLALENLPRNENLFYLMQPTQQSARRRLPSEEGLTLALQFANLLKLAHSQRIVYLDHKVEHVYWNGSKLRVIDFNSSRQLGTSAADRNEYIKDIHNLSVGILYTIFTGMSPKKTTLRPQPGGMETVESRYNEVTELDFMMEPTLSRALIDLLQRGAAMKILSVDEFMQGLHEVAALHGRDFPEQYTSPASRDARDHMRRGLQMMREGEGQIREARDLFREALILDGITEDVENELRRLVKAVNAMLNHRAIP